MQDSEVFPEEYKKTKNELVLFGFPDREASIYVALLIRGESRAAEITTFLGLHRLDVYHDLKSLQSKNVVEATIAKPMKFKAIPLEVVVRELQRKDID